MTERARRPEPSAAAASTRELREPSGPVPVAEAGIDAPTAAILKLGGIERLHPPQAAALGSVHEGRSVVLACPTASGKSLVAYLALLRAAKAHRTGLYLVPLRALAQEKFEELSEFAPLGVRVGISIGDFDLPNAALDELDILVATSEKADALLRKGNPWLDRLGVVVADEVHLMRDPDRGPTLEVSLTRLRRRHPDLQIVALSATVGNSRDIAEWLGADHLASNFRPIPLRSGVYREGRITFTDLATRPIGPPGEALPRLVRTVIEDGGQALVFVSTRKGSEQGAGALGPTVRRLLTPDDRARTAEAVGELLSIAEEETEGIRRLAALMPDGVAFHNASLTNAERRVVERAFRDRVLKVLVATPTLAAGINLPARRVIVRDTTRYDDHLGVQAPIPALEIQQMCGRAGRPRFDSAGEAVLIARSIEEEERFFDDYLSAPPEDVVSRLAAEPALRMHLLALVASGEVRDERELSSFFSSTYYGHTMPLVDLNFQVHRVREFLGEHEFLDRSVALRATAFGEMTSELYLDPLTAVLLRRALERAPIGVSPFALLAAISATPDLPPMFLRRSEEADLLARFADEEAELLVKPEEEPAPLDLDLFLATLKTATVLESWIDETPLVDLTARYGIGAGDVRAKVEDAEWLLFGASRLASRFQRRVARPIDDLSLRVRYGVREELLDLVRLRGVGRVRGRALFAAGYPDRESLRQAPLARISAILKSPKVAEAVLQQLRPTRPGRDPPPEDEAMGAPKDPSLGGSRVLRAVGGSPRRASRTLEEFHSEKP
ncbi:MAG: DEAD/DEAH box helicase [Thermoplasmata archaeon]|nr:DEAD/DEAH box helicase [Thermoplasmata archaeon]